MRLFLALPIPSKIQDSLNQIAQTLQPQTSTGRFVSSDHYHITLTFLGEHPSAALQTIQDAMEQVTLSPFPVTLQHLGRFRQGRSDLLWYGVQPDPTLLALQQCLAEALRIRGFALEKRPFRPHITIARDAKLLPQVSLEQLQETLPTLQFTCDKISLMLSKREQGRLCYQELSRKELV